jgi:hypothetical protein
MSSYASAVGSAAEFWEMPKKRGAAPPTAANYTGLDKHDVRRDMDFALKSFKCPNVEEFMRLLPFKILYDRDPDAFVITCGIHQNSPTDVLHYSVRVAGNQYKGFVTLHFNGYIPPTGNFITTNITIQYSTCPPQLLCNFVSYGSVSSAEFYGDASTVSAGGGGGGGDSDNQSSVSRN